MSDSPLTVAVLAGGRSSEHEVSLSSAAAVRDGLLEAGHHVVWIEIGRDSAWRRDGKKIALTPGEGLGPEVHVVFPVLHGPFGEDGTVQGLLEMLDVPYVGAGVTASAVCMDKVLFKDLIAKLGIPQVDYVGVRAARYCREAEAVHEEVRRACGWPVFVKPAHLGSSVGIVKVHGAEGLPQALAAAFEHDDLVIVEAMAAGKEIECGVLGTLALENEGPFVSEPGEIAFQGEFYDYEAKYSPGGMELLVPAGISAAARSEVGRLAALAFESIGCEGLARADFFVDGETVLLNELNTMPGFTPTSVYAKLLAASGVPYPELVERLCRLALARHQERARYRF